MTTCEIILSFLFAVALCFAVFFFLKMENYRKALIAERTGSAVASIVRIHQNASPLPFLIGAAIGGFLLFRHLRKTSEK